MFDEVTTGGTTAVADPSASPAAPVAPADHGASPAPGSAAPSPAPPAESPNIRQLREQYETTKKNLEPWERLGVQPADVARDYPLLAKMRGEALELGTQLGYDPQEVQEFFLKDPIALLTHLRGKAEQTQQTLSPADLRKQLDRMVSERLQPITQREDVRMNKEAEFKFDGEFDRLYRDNFKDGLPDSVREALYEMVGQLVGDDDQAIRRLKFDGQVSDVARYFDQAKTRVLKAFTDWSEHERKRTGTGPAPPNGQAAVKPKSALDAKISTGQSVRELFNL